MMQLLCHRILQIYGGELGLRSDSLQPPYDGCDEAQCSHIGFEFSVIAGCYSSEILEAIEGAFDDVSLTVEFPVIVILDFAI